MGCGWFFSFTISAKGSKGQMRLEAWNRRSSGLRDARHGCGMKRRGSTDNREMKQEVTDSQPLEPPFPANSEKIGSDRLTCVIWRPMIQANHNSERSQHEAGESQTVGALLVL